MLQRVRGKRRYLWIEVPEELYARVVATHKPYGAFCEAAIRKELDRDPEVAERFKVLSLTPRSDATVDMMLEWILSRRATVNDLLQRPEEGIGRACSGGGWELDREVARAIRDALPPVQAARVERLMKGATLEQIGRDDGCSRQAAHQAVRRAFVKLQRHEPFVRALCSLYPESGLTPAHLMSAVNQARAGGA